MIGCFRFVMYCASGNCYANMNVEQFQRHKHLITISNNRHDWLLSFFCISSEIYYHRRLKKHVEVKKAMCFRTLS